MARVPHPLDDPALWNQGFLGPDWLPGRCECAGIPVGRKLDAKKPGKKSGGTITDKGYEPAKFKIKLHQWTRAHFEAWQELFPRINPHREGATKDPYTFQHAQAIEADLGPIQIESITCGPWDSKGKRVIEISVKEWFAEPKKVKPGTGKVASSQQKTPLNNLVGTGLNPLLSPGSGLVDPADPNEIMRKLLGQ